MRERWCGAALLVLAAACSGTTGSSAPTTTASSARVTTTERHAPPTVPTTEPSAPTTDEPPALGLPDSFPLPPAGVLSISGSPGASFSFDVHGVAVADVVAYVHEQLLASGYEITDQTATTIGFAADQLSGMATISEAGGDEVDVVFDLSEPLG